MFVDRSDNRPIPDFLKEKTYASPTVFQTHPSMNMCGSFNWSQSKIVSTTGHNDPAKGIII
jgi:hypothetical protein